MYFSYISGQTGPVFFDKHGNILGDILIKQFVPDGTQDVGIWDGGAQEILITGKHACQASSYLSSLFAQSVWTNSPFPLPTRLP